MKFDLKMFRCRSFDLKRYSFMAEDIDYLEKMSFELYKFEHDRKEKLYSSAAIPLASIPLVLGGFGFSISRMPSACLFGECGSISLFLSAAYGSFLVAFVCALLALWNALGLLVLNQYKYLPSVQQLLTFRSELEAYYSSLLGDHSSEIADDIKHHMIHECGVATDFNIKTNDSRIQHRTKFVWWLVSASIFLVLHVIIVELSLSIFGNS